MKILVSFFLLFGLFQAKFILKDPYKKFANYKDVQIYEDTSVPFELAGVKGFSGYATVQKNYGSALFYMYTEATNQPAQATVIWLQGGPGSSSLYGALQENIGPFQIQSDGRTPFKLANSWGDRYSLLFIDQPIGTGYSTKGSGPLRSSTWQSSNDFLVAMSNIRKMHPDWFQRDLYIFGESYAGHYVPTYAYVMQQSGLWPELKGIGVGDGIHDAYTQFLHYADQLFSIGFLTVQQFQQVQQLQQEGRTAIENKQWVEAAAALDQIMGFAVGASGGVNIYNSREFGSADLPYAPNWLNLNTTKRTFGVPSEKVWVDSSDTVYAAFVSDIAAPYIDFFDTLLKNIRVLLYCGQDDIIINAASWEEFVKALKWDGADIFNKLNRKPWHLGDQVAGYWKQYKNLTQLIVLKTGHMVPLDQPEVSREMLRVFINNLSWEN